jgi:hypothetical protein
MTTKAPKPIRKPSRTCAHCGSSDDGVGPRPIDSALRWVGEAMLYGCSADCVRELGWAERQGVSDDARAAWEQDPRTLFGEGG